MTKRPSIRPVLCALAGSALAGLVLVGLGAAPAGAAPQADGLCKLLPALCPPTTLAPKAPPTTAKAAAPTTLPPRTSPPTTSRATATTAPTATAAPAAPSRVSQGQPSIGAPGLGAPAGVSGVLPALGTGSDPAAPQLAATPTPSRAASPARPSSFPGLVATATGPVKGLPNDHSRLRLALSLLVLVIAGVAAAQLPESRRSPGPEGPG